MCKRICEVVMGILMVVLGLLPLNPAVHRWLLVLLGVVLFVHAFVCKRCYCIGCETEVKPKKPARKK